MLPDPWTPAQQAQFDAEVKQRQIDRRRRWDALTAEKRANLDVDVLAYQAQVARHEAAMHSREKIEAFLADLCRICEAHDVVLFGTCGAEGIFGEITIGRLSDASSMSWEMDDPYRLQKSPGDFANWEILGFFPRLPEGRKRP